MKSISEGKFFVILLVGILILPEFANAAAEYATFESFYRPSLSWPWIIGGAVVAAIIGGAVIVFTGGAASPIVVGVGTWVGGLMGFSGAAAANAGLALLGGGSIATGGLGVLGGAALLTAVFSFGTTVVIDYGTGKAVEAYDYSRFAENSKKMTTLPLPRNTSGPDSYEDALEVLEDVNQGDALFTNKNQAVIQKAIGTIKFANKVALTSEEGSREQSLLALLYFTNNDYVAAKRHADVAYRLALNANVKATLPAFIYATSSMYDEKPDFKRSTAFFNYAVTNEFDNPLSPLLFAIYLDRVMYRFNDGYLPYSSLDSIYNLSKPLQYDERKAVIQLGLLNRYLTSIKLEQQKVISLAGSPNKTIKDSPKTLMTVQGALREYKSLLTRSKSAIDDQASTLKPRLERPEEFFDKVTGKGIKEWETKWSGEIGNMHTLWTSYSNGVAGLESQVKALESYQAELERARLEKAKSEKAQQTKGAVSGDSLRWWPYVTFIFVTLLIGAYLFRRRTLTK